MHQSKNIILVCYPKLVALTEKRRFSCTLGRGRGFFAKKQEVCRTSCSRVPLTGRQKIYPEFLCRRFTFVSHFCVQFFFENLRPDSPPPPGTTPLPQPSFLRQAHKHHQGDRRDWRPHLAGREQAGCAVCLSRPLHTRLVQQYTVIGVRAENGGGQSPCVRFQTKKSPPKEPPKQPPKIKENRTRPGRSSVG